MSVREKLHAYSEANDEIEQTRADFRAYADEFAADVADKRNPTDFHDEVATLQGEIEATAATFGAYVDELEADVGAFRADIDEFRTGVDRFREAVANKRQLFVGLEEDFDAYADAFAVDVADRQDITDLLAAIDELHQEFLAVRSAFDAYGEEFDAAVDAFQADIDSRREDYRMTTEAFVEYADEFYDVDVGALLAAIHDLQEEVETIQAAFDVYAVEFWGADLEESDEPTEAPVERAVDPEADAEEIEVGSADADEVVGTGGEIEDSDEFQETAEESGTQRGDGRSEDMNMAAEEGKDVESVDLEPGGEVPDDMVQCLVCGEYYKAITEPHLQTHDMSIQSYRAEYGDDVPLRPGDE